ncbi:MAG: zinc metalloprotease [Acidobacteria bacterium]|nr:MAG: zinc metalloprotease [Acidobacteriota bacterium]
MQVHYRLLEQDPDFRLRQAELEQRVNERLMAGAAGLRGSVTTIPAVVHVVYRTSDEKVAAAQVKSQLAALNKDYRATNPDRSSVPPVWLGLVTDARVQFALATRDPTGKKTAGIVYVPTTLGSFPADDSVKAKATGGADGWPSDRYLNVWVCTLADGLLGYAQFPGGPPKTDGVVVLNRAFGTTGTATAPFDLGRSATHEIGHWLNLRHVWSDTEDCTGSDFVADTPTQQHPNYGQPRFPHVSCHNGPNGDMFMNYMDYVDDDAMFMFTAQQVVRMQASLDGPRSSIGK